MRDAQAMGGKMAPAKDEARGTNAGQAGQHQQGHKDFPMNGAAEQAALLIEGEAYAAAYLQRLKAGTTQPGELAIILSFLSGAMLQGACRAIEKALEVAYA